nr:pentatricopeptide repeat-containing protein [Tanacetum cinerariifolium]
MAPSGSPFLIFDVHYDGTFNFMPPRYENGLVYNWSVCKDSKVDLATALDKGKGLVDKGKGKMVDEGNSVKSRKSARSRNSGIIIKENVNPSFSEDDDSDSDLDMEQMFQEGEDELISHRKRNNEAKKIIIQVIARYGFGLQKLKVIEKGKQRKHNKYPSTSRDELSNCPFRCYGKTMVTKKSFQIISVNEEHTCVRNFKSYGKAISYSNGGSIVKLGVNVNPDDKTNFDRFYCCFYGLKKGFQLGCRPVIALDGCFLMKSNIGETLIAVGRDGNNHIYLIAWAIMNVENKDNRSWFLQFLGIRRALLMLEILSRRFFLKLNLSDHRSILTDLQETSKGNGGRYEHANLVSLKAQDGGVHMMMNRDYAWLMISRHSILSQTHVKDQANV